MSATVQNEAIEETPTTTEALLARLGRQRYTAYKTASGVLLKGQCEEILAKRAMRELRGRVQLCFFSPPFPLNRKKAYDNRVGDEYRSWLAGLAPLFAEYLTQDGSIVIELGNAWEPGIPAMSTLALEAMLDFKRAASLHLCQQFVCHNPARLPTPAQWVNVKRCRVVDSFTHLWWLARHPEPYADNRNVLRPYSPSMLKLLKTKKYNDGIRPSEHNIGKTSFLTSHGGSIPPNVLTFSNTNASDPYLDHCRKYEIKTHPARMPIGVPEFFVKFLTRPGDLVLDPFGGSNTTGAAAEQEGRRWIAIEPDASYIEGSRGRFSQ